MQDAAPTAAGDRAESGRPKSVLSWVQLLAVTAYWLAITVLWGAFTFSVIPRLVESPGVLGSSNHPPAGPAPRPGGGPPSRSAPPRASSSRPACLEARPIRWRASPSA